MTKTNALKTLLPPVVLLLLLWLTRLVALDAFPFHVDEGIHTRWAVEVWHGHPFWYISDAKIIAHWPIAAFYPQHAATFVARVPTVMVALVGLAAGYALSRRLFGAVPALMAAVLWLTSPYLFFYERLALMDAEIGALGVLALWASVVLALRGTVRNAVLAGVSLALAVLFKLTAVTFVPMVALIPLLNARYPLRRRLNLGAVAVAACAACFIIPIGYMVLKAENFFDVPRQFISVGGGSSGMGMTLVDQFFANIEKLWLQLIGFGQPLWVLALLAGLILLALFGGRWGRLLLVAAALSLAIILILGKTVFPRYYVALLPIALVLAGSGIGLALARLHSAYFARPSASFVPDKRGKARVRLAAFLLPTLLSAALLISVLPFMLTAYADPAALTLSDAMREQYYTGPSAGFGLREAAQSFPEVLSRRDIPVIASMRPDTCIQANYYALDGLTLICADAPGTEAINAALNDFGAVYVLTDHAPLIGIDVSTLDAAATHIADYPRPGESSPSVTLWLLER